MRAKIFRYRQSISAFTILEVLIALTASLLLMLGLTRAFKLIGDRITSSQSDLEMASSLREVTFRMRDELRRMTPTMTAPQPSGSDAGYFTYYEGPWSDATTTLVHGATAITGTPRYYPTSRYGDLDDFLAFTTRSEPGKPFSGVVPSGVIEAIRLFDHIQGGSNPDTFLTLSGRKVRGSGSAPFYTTEDAYQPQLIYSEIAEVVYFLSPGWNRTTEPAPSNLRLGIPDVARPANSVPPDFVDLIDEASGGAAGDGIPDQLTLRRRVLLVRNDLNMTVGEMTGINALIGGTVTAGLELNQRQIPFLRGRPMGTEVVRLVDETRYTPAAWLPSVSDIPNSPNWLSGMARPLQWMDLSVSRLTNQAVGAGTPVEAIKANSLDELSRPDNRFASVRMPIDLLSGGSTMSPFTASMTSSMPVLALSPPHDLITANTTADVINSGSVVYSAMGAQALGTPPYSQFSMVGFVRPEFSLADHWYDVMPAMGLPAANPTLRGGSDIIASDVLGFDVQVLDEAAPVAFWFGDDGVPGSVGDDDVNGTANDEPELGYANSDDDVVDVGSVGFRTALSRFDTSITATPDFGVVSRGAFVDYGYARLAGGPVGGILPTRVPTAPLRTLLATPYSGIEVTPLGALVYPSSWMSSGRFLIPGAAGTVNAFYQPTIDTWSDFYDLDGFEQPFLGNPPPQSVNLQFTGNPTSAFTTRYWSNAAGTNQSAGFVDGVQEVNSESIPPQRSMPKAIKITVRVYDRSAGEVRQQSVIQHFTNQLK